MSDKLAHRIASLDTLRGIAVALMLFDGRELWSQLRHSNWEGFTIYDLVYPCFLFVGGLTFGARLPRNFNSRIDRGKLRTVWIRGARLFFLGVLLSSLTSYSLTVNLATLQCIAISFSLASTVYLAGGIRFSLATAVLIYLIYFLLSIFFGVPGASWEDRWLEETAFTSYLDRILLGKPRSEEGILPTLCAVTYFLAGATVGQMIFVRKSESEIKRLFLGILVAAFAAVLVASLDPANIFFIPILSRGFSPTYCLISISLLTALFLAAHAVIDLKGIKTWTIPIRILGINALTAYCFYRSLSKGILRHVKISVGDKKLPLEQWLLGPNLTPLALSAILLFFTWLLCYILWRKQRIISL